MPNTNSSSRNNKPPHFAQGLRKSTQRSLGRFLVSTGGRSQVLGADLIDASAEDQASSRWRTGIYGLIGAAALALVAFMAWGAAAEPVLPPRETHREASVTAW